MSEEHKRLDALTESGLLDSEPSESLQRYIRIAHQALGVPVVLISLVDDRRQFFANSVGLPSPWAERRETPLSHSFCKYVVHSRQPLIVSDAPRDERVKDNLAIPDLGVIAYAGFPIDTDDSHTVGSFCAIDGKTREWTERELGLLKEIAACIGAEVDLRRQLQRMVRHEKVLAEINDNLLEGQARASDLDATFRHDLRSPLQVITMGITALMRSPDFAPSPQLTRTLTLIERNAGHAVSIINMMKHADAELEAAVAANSVVADAVQNYRDVHRSITVCEVQNDALRVRINPTNLRRCIENLLSNSVRFATSRIEVALRREGNLAALTVDDDGPGLPSAQAYQAAWNSGATFHNDEGQSGTGLGLNIVQNIVERAGGHISSGPSSLGGARFGLWLPVVVES